MMEIFKTMNTSIFLGGIGQTTSMPLVHCIDKSDDSPLFIDFSEEQVIRDQSYLKQLQKNSVLYSFSLSQNNQHTNTDYRALLSNFFQQIDISHQAHNLLNMFRSNYSFSSSRDKHVRKCHLFNSFNNISFIEKTCYKCNQIQRIVGIVLLHLEKAYSLVLKTNYSSRNYDFSLEKRLLAYKMHAIDRDNTGFVGISTSVC